MYPPFKRTFLLFFFWATKMQVCIVGVRLSKADIVLKCPSSTKSHHEMEMYGLPGSLCSLIELPLSFIDVNFIIQGSLHKKNSNWLER